MYEVIPLLTSDSFPSLDSYFMLLISVLCLLHVRLFVLVQIARPAGNVHHHHYSSPPPSQPPVHHYASMPQMNM